MDKKCLTYSVEDFTQDLNFINWVNNGINPKEWENFVLENPGISKDIHTAKKNVIALRYNQKELPEAKVYEIYKNIDTFHILHHKSNRTFLLRKLMQYAAPFVLVFSIGTVIPYLYFTRSTDRFTEMPVLSSGINEAKLFLSRGEENLLRGKQTEVEFNSTGSQVKIDQERVIVNKSNADQGMMAQVIVPYGRRMNLILSDGTKVWLNAGSKLVFPQRFTGKSRKVFLRGEAYFDVFKDDSHSFVVSTDKMDNYTWDRI